MNGPTEAVRAAWAIRRERVQAESIEAYRLVNGPGDGAPEGLTIDVYGTWLVLSVRDGASADVQAWADAASELLRADGVVLKRLRQPASRSESEVSWGELPRPLQVREGDAVFLVDLDDGPSTGLFLDQRETRRHVRTYAHDREVLNLFSYTCSFSTHAALAGARRVTSVDVSKKALQRGRENMAASGLDPDAHRWFTDGVLEHLERAARRGDRYGLIILDPPTFGRSKKRSLALERDLEGLLASTVELLEPGGVLVACVHGAQIGASRLEEAARSAARGDGSSPARVVEVLERFGLPWDHPAIDAPSDRDRGAYLKTLVLQYG